MALEYIGNGMSIVGIPAKDLSDEELTELAKREAPNLFGRDSVSLAELEGLLIERKIYKSVPKKSAAKAVLETKDGE